MKWQIQPLSVGGAMPPAHPPLHVAPPAAAAPGGGAGAAASVAPEPLAAALSVASS